MKALWWCLLTLLVLISVVVLVVFATAVLRYRQFCDLQDRLADTWKDPGDCLPSDARCELAADESVWADAWLTRPDDARYQPLHARALSEFLVHMGLVDDLQTVTLEAQDWGAPHGFTPLKLLRAHPTAPVIGVVWRGAHPDDPSRQQLVVSFRGTLTVEEVQHDLDGRQVPWPVWRSAEADEASEEQEDSPSSSESALSSGSATRARFEDRHNLSRSVTSGLLAWIEGEMPLLPEAHVARAEPSDDLVCPLVHHGFFALYACLRTDLHAALVDHGSECETWWFTGHSLGGALCALACLDLADPAAVMPSGAEPKPLACYMFGVPRVGNQALAQLLQTYLETGTRLAACWRVVNAFDAIQDLPTTLVPNFAYVKARAQAQLDSVQHTAQDEEEQAETEAQQEEDWAAHEALVQVVGRPSYVYTHVGPAAVHSENWYSLRVNHFMPYYVYASLLAVPETA